MKWLRDQRYSLASFFAVLLLLYASTHQKQLAPPIEIKAVTVEVTPTSELQDTPEVTDESNEASPELGTGGPEVPDETVNDSTGDPPDTPQFAPRSTRFVWPVHGPITQPFLGRAHTGIDIGVRTGTPVIVSQHGLVTWAGWNNTGYGYRIMVNHDAGITTTYNHLSSIRVSIGQYVFDGQIIALSGSTGRSSGSHLHFEVLRFGVFQPPLQYLS